MCIHRSPKLEGEVPGRDVRRGVVVKGEEESCVSKHPDFLMSDTSRTFNQFLQWEPEWALPRFPQSSPKWVLFLKLYECCVDTPPTWWPHGSLTMFEK